MKILGISCFYHDSAAALLLDGKIKAAAQEERFTRIKHDASFPLKAIEYCLKEAGLTLEQVDAVVFYEKPFLKFERLLETHLAQAPFALKSYLRSMPLWLVEKIFQKKLLLSYLQSLGAGEDISKKIFFSQHHLSHAASAFYPSPFTHAAVLTLDGVGEWSTTTLGIGNENNLTLTKEIRFPHSLGLLYSAFTYYTGFKVNSGEYKLMGLAPYGKPIYADLVFNNLIDLKEDGSYRLNTKYFGYLRDMKMTNEKFHELFSLPVRGTEEKLTQKHMDLAASIQFVTEEVVLKMARNLRQETGEKNLCLAGGVALNCVANGKIQKQKIFENIWIQPAAGDAGGALGAALAYYHMALERPRLPARDQMQGAYLGPQFSEAEIEKELIAMGAKFQKLAAHEVVAKTAQHLSEGKAIGWFQGRMEFGPRALGGRSIIADARSKEMQTTLNLKVKFRESFRPFAPSVLAEKCSAWFDIDCDSPYMLLVANVQENKKLSLDEKTKALFGLDLLKIPKSEIPAVTHVDYSARIQTVHEDTNPRYHQLIKEFEKLTGCPVIVNTSFNVRGEPIVCTPSDAFRCFMGTHLDVLVVENFILYKEEQNQDLVKSYFEKFELD